MMAVSIFTITFMTLAIAGLALGFGTLFPQFDTENAAQIPTSFGGLVFMMSVGALIGGGRDPRGAPVYSYLSARGVRDAGRAGRRWSSASAWRCSLCVAATLVPIEVALRRLEAVERVEAARRAGASAIRIAATDCDAIRDSRGVFSLESRHAVREPSSSTGLARSRSTRAS